MARIKICGIRRYEDVDYVNRAVPDYIGFILSDGFKRSVDIAFASELTGRIDAGIKKIGVFVDEDFDFITNAIDEVKLDIVQLHGNESPELCKAIDTPVIKVLKPNDFDKIRDFEPYVDYFLFDSGTGTGRVFDWSNIPKTAKPFFLAGGIDCDNIELAIRRVEPFAIDLSSSVETDGYKDYKKIKQIIDIVRSIK